MKRRSVARQTVKTAQPEPSVLIAAWENSCLNLSNDPKSLLIYLARVPVGAPPPFGAGAMFSQKSLWSTNPPTWNDNSLATALTSNSKFERLSNLFKIALAPSTYA